MATTTDAPPLITPELLKQLYTGILTHRLTARAKRARSLAGREAIDVAFAANMSERDMVFAYRTSLMAQFARSATVTELSSVAAAAPEGAPVEVAVGIAHHVAMKTEKDAHRDVVISISSTAERIEWQRALSFSGSQKPPIVLLLEHEAAQRGGAALERIATTADAYGIPPMYVDGKDAIALFRVAQEAIFRARNGGAPTLVIAHLVGENQPRTGLRRMLTSDALASMQEHLERKALWSKDWAEHAQRELRDELAGKGHRPLHGYRSAHHKKQ